MYVLGIESATPVASAAVTGGDGILAERMVRNGRTHSVNLLPMIKAVMEEAEITRADLAGIAVSVGPGSFTGLRIGMSIAKTLAQIWELPIVGVSTLDGLAHALNGHKNLVCPILNARKNELYTAVYDYSNPEQSLLMPHRAAKAWELIEILAAWQRPVTFLGDGLPVYQQQLYEGLGDLASFAPFAHTHPRGGIVAELGRTALAESRGVDPLELQPEYIRFSEAEVLWQKKQKAGG